MLVTVGSEEKAAFATGIGADAAILYDQVNFADAAREATGGNGVHVVYDSSAPPPGRDLSEPSDARDGCILW